MAAGRHCAKQWTASGRLAVTTSTAPVTIVRERGTMAEIAILLGGRFGTMPHLAQPPSVSGGGQFLMSSWGRFVVSADSET